MKEIGNLLILFSIPFCAWVVDVQTMGFIAGHGGGILFILLIGGSAISSGLLVLVSAIIIIRFTLEKEKEDYFPFILHSIILSFQLFVWYEYINESM